MQISNSHTYKECEKREGKEQDQTATTNEGCNIRFNSEPRDYKEVYKKINVKIEENDYHLNGSTIEIFTSKSKKREGKTILKSKIQIPANKK